jgi:hypothetical protein
MANFSDHPDVIIAEVDVVLHRAAVSCIIGAQSFPAFVDLVRGHGTTISIRAEFFDFPRHTQSLIEDSPICPSCDPQEPHSCPIFVLAGTSCKVQNSICHSADAPLEKSLRGSRSGSEFRMDIFCGAAAALTLNASHITETVALLRGFSREPLGSSDLRRLASRAGKS